MEISLDNNKIQEAADKSALKGALAAIDEFYTSYNSPFKKQITDILSKMDHTINLVSIVDTFKVGVEKELEKHAQIASAKSILELFNNGLSEILKSKKSIKFSEFLTEVKSVAKNRDCESINLTLEKKEKYNWIDCNISFEDQSYDFTLHEDTKYEDGKFKPTGFYKIISFPSEGRSKKVKVSYLGASIEFDANRSIMGDGILLNIACMVLNDTLITMDQGIDQYNYDLDIEQDECHCN